MSQTRRNATRPGQDVATRDARPGKPTVILVLQGGGALGAYHIGAFQALEEAGYVPDWFCGISIGAINATLLAGNAPDKRLSQLEAFWEAISWPEVLPVPDGAAMRALFNNFSHAQALLFGQPHFFSPRWPNPYFATPGIGATSFYDTSPLRQTLRSYADFDRINGKDVRISVGATDVETGSLIFFDNTKMSAPFEPEHPMASGSLPPGFPPTRIGDRLYWDGGCVSNTPLEAVLQDMPRGHAVVFMIDLWSATGPAPTTMNEVLWRAKQIQYASRTAEHIDAVATKVNLRHAMRRMTAPDAEAGSPDEQRLDIVHLVYHPSSDQIPASDAEFSRASIAERRSAGYADMRHALDAAPWHRVQKPEHLGCMVHRVAGAEVTTCAEPNLGATSDWLGPTYAD